MNRPARSLLSLALLALAACAGATGLALPFSGLAPGTPPEKWIHTTLPKVARASVFDLVDDGVFLRGKSFEHKTKQSHKLGDV